MSSPAAVLLGVAWVPEPLPQQWRPGLTAGAGVMVVGALWRSVTTYLAVRRPFSQPVTSEWDYQLVRTDDEDWVVLPLLGDTAHWAMYPGRDEGHPAAAGRCGIRGDLEEGGAFHIRIEGRFWMPSSPVVRVMDEFRQDGREDLVTRLVGDPATLEEGASPRGH